MLHDLQFDVERLGRSFGVLAGVSLIDIGQFDRAASDFLEFSTHAGHLMPLSCLRSADDDREQVGFPAYPRRWGPSGRQKTRPVRL